MPEQAVPRTTYPLARRCRPWLRPYNDYSVWLRDRCLLTSLTGLTYKWNVKTAVELQDAKDAESIELVFDNGPVRHQLSQNQEKGGTFYKSFSDKPLSVLTMVSSADLLRIYPLLRCNGIPMRRWLTLTNAIYRTFARLSVSVRLREQPSHESITISFDNVASKLQGNECRHYWGNKLIILKVIPQCRLAVRKSVGVQKESS
ncbi:hypothetical protein PISMIDRAFT_539207 [Pisolithus microcarpus 441]|uniref:Unplaced genomic scaffold scaffold_67, whole genome shotgun sequence n=1 Tax=Pisolithus microcarpus 441 TaxID=765257 RepID=A0A0C9ZNV2_9AGAM|nr:hypothetical protein PISMIDRAFT_539207 [Pisolithus microcarpus 441]